MSDARADKQRDRDDPDGERAPLPTFGGTIFLQQAAHVAVVDARGRIITVNDAWTRFGGDNGLAATYQFVGVSYPEICQRAIDATHGGEGAREALGGINGVLAAQEKRFSLIYPCHAPQRKRWFLMFVRPIGGEAQGAVVSHIDVTSLYLAGLVPDETARPGTAKARQSAEQLARTIFPDFSDPSAFTSLRLR
jgi:hypothetical protein